MHFTLEHTAKYSKARAGILKTDHSTIETPVFMPVGTQATVKTQTPRDLLELNSNIILANTYHLYLRPTTKLIAEFGGIHNFMKWEKSILTDSGGFQVYSLKELRSISEDGVSFQSHLDGSSHIFTPESVLQAQREIGSDIMMVLDECPAHDASFEYVQKSNSLTLKWALIARTLYDSGNPLHGYNQWLFAIVQGGTFENLREISATELVKMDFPGYAIGGLAVGESKEHMYHITDFSTDILPDNKPRYLMGVGTPEDLLECIDRGIDMFDCVMPTRNARNGTVFSWQGKITIKAATHKDKNTPIDEKCTCYVCTNFSRAYIRHLLNVNEILGLWLTTHHNLAFYMQLMSEARVHIQKDTFKDWKTEILKNIKLIN